MRELLNASERRRYLLILGVFSVAMAFLETAVVYYLRMLYYPEGFSFPLQALELNVAAVEILREAATLIMLVSVAWLVARSFTQGFAWFIWCFAVWDIFYYIFLYLTLQWPESLLTWDVLFLIPLTWTGPVLAPLINSVMMIALAWIILKKSAMRVKGIIRPLEWSLLIIGSLIIIGVYVADYTSFMLGGFSLLQLLWPAKNAAAIIEMALQYVPRHFNGWLFAAGCSLHLLAIVRIALRQRE